MNTIKNRILTAIGVLEKGEKISGEELASLVSEIADLEIEEGGPYFLESQFSDENPDFGLNLLIAYFLLLLNVDLPKLDKFLEENSKNKNSTFLSDSEIDDFKNRRQKLKEIRTAKIKEAAYSSDEKLIMEKIIEFAEKRFENLSPDFQNSALAVIKKIIDGNADKQMSLMPYYVKSSLAEKYKKEISDDLIAKMGLANIFFWTAFIIYDDFWDEDEAADPKILPGANLFSRHFTDFFVRELSGIFPVKSDFHKFFHKLMDDLDGANTWETIYCRTEINGSKFTIPDNLPDYADYENKYRPASGHILGPIAILLKLGYSLDSEEVKNFISYFRNYLIAMQINDDAHDWEEDMRRGHLSTVVVMLLRDLNWQKKEIDLKIDLKELKKVFWFKTIKRAGELAVFYSEKSRQALEKISIFENKSPLLRFPDITEKIAQKAVKEQSDSMDFLKIYENQ